MVAAADAANRLSVLLNIVAVVNPIEMIEKRLLPMLLMCSLVSSR